MEDRVGVDVSLVVAQKDSAGPHQNIDLACANAWEPLSRFDQRHGWIYYSGIIRSLPICKQMCGVVIEVTAIVSLVLCRCEVHCASFMSADGASTTGGASLTDIITGFPVPLQITCRRPVSRNNRTLTPSENLVRSHPVHRSDADFPSGGGASGHDGCFDVYHMAPGGGDGVRGAATVPGADRGAAAGGTERNAAARLL